MSTLSRQERRGERTRLKVERWRAQRKLRQRQKAEGMTPFPTATIANAKNEWTTVEEEKQVRQ